MSHFLHDADEWEAVFDMRPCGSCNGDMRKCNGMCNGSSGSGQRQRDPVEVARIKAERLRKEEDEILQRADAIRTARATTNLPAPQQ